MRRYQFLHILRFPIEDQQFQKRPSQIPRAAFVEHGVVGLADHFQFLGDVAAAEHEVSTTTSTGGAGEGTLSEIIVVEGVTTHGAYEAVGVGESRGVFGGEESAHDAAFGDYEVFEGGEEVGCVAVCGEDDVAG